MTYYNEQCLFSSFPAGVSAGTLSEPFTNFERIKIKAGWSYSANNYQSEGNVWQDYGTYTAFPYFVGVNWPVGAGNELYSCLTRLSFTDSTHFKSVTGVLYNWNKYEKSPNWSPWNLLCVKEIWGINRKQ